MRCSWEEEEALGMNLGRSRLPEHLTGIVGQEHGEQQLELELAEKQQQPWDLVSIAPTRRRA
uniref:Uncharacterized protein n=1 Tax=Arundo donax TaxID=35708 RepID=A0A0A9BQT9_ARUDO